MNLTAISENIQSILNVLEATKTLPNNPNIGGILEETTIVFAITEGSYEMMGIVNLTLKVSLACQFREEPETLNAPVLNNLISLVINTLHRKVIPFCKPMNLVKFENFTPDSGKWRAMIELTIPAHMVTPDINLDVIPKLDRINIAYDHQC